MTLQGTILRRLYAFVSPGWRSSVVAGFIGEVASLLSPRKKVALENLSRAFPNRDSAWKKEVLSSCYHHLAWSIVEFMCLAKMPDRVGDWFVSVSGEDTLKRLRAEGKGAILLTGHIGNWELLAGWFANKGYPIHAIVRPPNDIEVASILEEFRARVGLKTFSKYNIMLGAARLAKKGAFMAILADQDGGNGGIHVPFMGESCSTPGGPAALSHLAGVPIIPVVSYRISPFRHEVHIYEPLGEPDIKDRSGRIEYITAEANIILEKMIREHPEQWLWLHRRWKNKG